jgi:hypothetical protein
MAEKVPPQPPQMQEPLHYLRINGQCALPRDAKRILTVPAIPVDKDDIATKPLETASRGFKLLR